MSNLLSKALVESGIKPEDYLEVTNNLANILKLGYESFKNPDLVLSKPKRCNDEHTFVKNIAKLYKITPYHHQMTGPFDGWSIFLFEDFGLAREYPDYFELDNELVGQVDHNLTNKQLGFDTSDDDNDSEEEEDSSEEESNKL